jgi:hypothetical protein
MQLYYIVSLNYNGLENDTQRYEGTLRKAEGEAVASSTYYNIG